MGFITSCGQQVGRKKRCGGAGLSAILVNDWESCQQCGEHGYAEGKRCAACQGSGFIFVRDKPWLRQKKKPPANL